MRRSCGRAVERRGTVRAVFLAVLAAGLLAMVPSLAQATYVTDFSTFQIGGPTVPTMGWPYGVQVTYNNGLYAYDHGELYEVTGGSRVLLSSGCRYGCSASVQPTASRDYAHPPTREFYFVFYNDRNVPYGERTLYVHERRPHYVLEGDFTWSPGVFHVGVSGSIGGGMPLDTIIYENGTEVSRCNVYWYYCTTPVTAGASYYAAVKDANGIVFAISASYRATSSTTGVKETADQI